MSYIYAQTWPIKPILRIEVIAFVIMQSSFFQKEKNNMSAHNYWTEIQHESVFGFFSRSEETSSWEVKEPRGRAMGCGGSRTDALEPRYLENWTKETESTWLTSTDADIPLSSIQSIPSDGSEAGFTSEKTISPGKKNESCWVDGWMNT